MLQGEENCVAVVTAYNSETWVTREAEGSRVAVNGPAVWSHS